MKKLVLFIFIFFGVAVVGAAAFFILRSPSSSDTGKAVNPTIKVGYASALTDQGFILKFAEDNNFFAKYKVNVVTVPSQKDPAQLLQSGQIDVTDNAVSSGLTAYLNNQNYVWVEATSRVPFQYGLSRYPKDQLSRIKSIGVVNLGGPGQINAAAFARQFVTNPSTEITFKLAPTDQAKLAMLENGQIDFAMVDSADLGDSALFSLTPQEVFGKLVLPTGIQTTSDILAKKKDSIKGFSSAVKDAINMIRDKSNEGVVKASIKKSYSLADAQTDTFYDNMQNSLTDLDFVPSQAYTSNILNAVTHQLNPTNPDRPLKDFLGNL